MTNPLTSPTKSLTDQQKVFKEAMLGPAAGDPVVAGELAGYAPGYCYSAARLIKDELIDAAKDILVLYGIKAAFTLANALDSDSIDAQTKIKLKAAQEVLDRIGIHKAEATGIDLTGANTIILFPAKEEIKNG